MQVPMGLRFAGLVSACAMLLAAQGLETNARPQDWEEINFEFNSAVLSDGYPSLLRLAELLHSHPDYTVTLEGNTDSIGSVRYNDKLSQRRSDTVAKFLEKYGANPGQIKTVAHGKGKPEVSNKSKEGRFMNRRVVMTVRDGKGNVVSAGGVGEAIKAMQEQEAAQRNKCCEDILKRLDKLDDILAAIKDLKNENDQLKQDVAALKQAQAGVEQKVAALPKPPERAELQQMMDTTANNAIEKAKPSRFSLVGVNVGPTLGSVYYPWLGPQGVLQGKARGAGQITFSGKGRYFAPFGKDETMAVQAEGEYMYYRDRQEGQFDIGLVNRWNQLQAGLFSSIKHVNLSDLGVAAAAAGSGITLPADSTLSPTSGGGTLGQAAFTADLLFSRGRIGFFGTKAYLTDRVIGRSAALVAGPNGTVFQNFNLMNEYFLRAVDQAGASAQVGLWDNAYVEGNIGGLFRSLGGNKAGGTVRLVQPITNRIAFTTEASLNETLVASKNTGRLVFGVQFGNWVRPKDFMTVKHPVPVDIPRVRYEVGVRQNRTGHTPPVADAGPDQIGIPAGTVQLDASGSYSPEGLPLTYQWSQIGGATVQISNPTSAKASFTGAEGQTYQFRVAVTDSLGAQAFARTTVTIKAIPAVQILNFSASPAAITAGQSSTLVWQVQNADTVTITPGLGTVNASGSTAISPTETTTYTLTASNAKGQVTQTVTVTVNQPELRIADFQANPTTIRAGQSSMLYWQTVGAQSVSISDVGSVALSGSTSVSPATTTTYTLTATGKNGQTTTATLTITVQVAPPTIQSFTANPASIFTGGGSQLCWQVQDANAVSISGLGTVQTSGCQAVQPADTTTYTLTATNAGGQSTASATVTVLPGAAVLSFTASPATIDPGQSSTLTWTTKNATGAFITGVGFVPVNGSVQVSPAATTTYTLKITGANGTTAQQDVTVTVTTSTPGTPPVAIITGGGNVETIYRQILIDACNSTGTAPLRFQWTVVPNKAVIISPNSCQTYVQMPEFNLYTFTVTVTDAAGQSSTANLNVNYVRVTNTAP